MPSKQEDRFVLVDFKSYPLPTRHFFSSRFDDYSKFRPSNDIEEYGALSYYWEMFGPGWLLRGIFVPLMIHAYSQVMKKPLATTKNGVVAFYIACRWVTSSHAISMATEKYNDVTSCT